jgi:acyl carrier protein
MSGPREAEVLRAVRDALAGIGRDAACLTDAELLDSTLACLDVDSMAAIEVAAHVEEAMGITFAESELAQVNLLADLVALTTSTLEASRKERA